MVIRRLDQPGKRFHALSYGLAHPVSPGAFEHGMSFLQIQPDAKVSWMNWNTVERRLAADRAGKRFAVWP